MSPTPSSLGRIGRHYPRPQPVGPGRSALSDTWRPAFEPAQHSAAIAVVVGLAALALVGWLMVLWAR